MKYTIEDRSNQPTHPHKYYKSQLFPAGKGIVELRRVLQRKGRVKLSKLLRKHDPYDNLFSAARGINILQTYEDGEFYWELFEEERKPLSIKPLSRNS